MYVYQSDKTRIWRGPQPSPPPDAGWMRVSARHEIEQDGSMTVEVVDRKVFFDRIDECH